MKPNSEISGNHHSPGIFRLAVLALTFMIAAGSQLARPTSSQAVTYFHPFIKEFGPNGTSSTHFAAAGNVAVDEVTHDIFVLIGKSLSSKPRVYRFDSSGSPDPFTKGVNAGKAYFTGLSPTGNIAVAPPGALGGTAGDLYVPEPSGVRIYSSSTGEPMGLLDSSGNKHAEGASETPCSVRTDPAGNLYVGYLIPESHQTSHIDKYVPTENPVSPADFDSQLTSATNEYNNVLECNFVVGSQYMYTGAEDGVVYKMPAAIFPGGGGTRAISKADLFPGTFGGEIPVAVAFPAPTLAIDPSTGAIYIGGAGHPEGIAGEPPFQELTIGEFDSEDHYVSLLFGPSATNAENSGMAVDGGTGQLYKFNIGGGGDPENARIFMFGVGEVVNPPIVSVHTPSGLTFSAAEFSGTVNAGGSGEGQETRYRFECSPSCPGLEGDRLVPADGEDHEVSDNAEGLDPETEYHLKLLARNRAGTVKAETVFTTPAKPIANAPTVALNPISGVTDHSAEASGSVNPNGVGEYQSTHYWFEYHGENTPGWVKIPVEGPIEGTESQVVEAKLEGLTFNRNYELRLCAENVGGKECAETSFKTEPAPPTVEASTNYVNEAGEVVLRGFVNPNESAVSDCRFVYGPAGSEANSEAPCEPLPGSGKNAVEVTASLAGLPPASSFRYRLLATNIAGTSEGEERPFETLAAEEPEEPCPNAPRREEQHSTELPECRAYEMVSPADKSGGDVSASVSRTRMAVEGDAVAFVSLTGFDPLFGANGLGTEYMAVRGSDGWATHGIAPPTYGPAQPLTRSLYVGDFSPDLSEGIFSSVSPMNQEDPNVADVRNLYLRTDLRDPVLGSYKLLTGCPSCSSPLVPGTGYPFINDPSLDGTSADFSHVLFESPLLLTAEAEEAGGGEPWEMKLYESVNGQVRLAGMVPAAPGADECTGAECVPAVESAAGLGGGQDPRLNTETAFWTPGTISADGSRVIFVASPYIWGGEAGSVAGNSKAGDLYLRENGVRTVKLNASERSEPDPHAPAPAVYGGASSDGSEIYFLSREALTENAEHGQKPNLYRYDVNAPAGHHLTLISPDATFVAGVSGDGGYVYFLSQESLRVWHDGSVRRISSGPGDRDNWGQDGLVTTALPNEFRMSPNGRYIAFATENQATARAAGFENSTKSPHCDESCAEVFAYAFSSDRLSCVSCPPGGVEPQGRAQLAMNSVDTTELTNIQHLSHALSDNGGHVFFDSTDPLVASDTNGKVDAYVYDAATGRRSLLSTGRSDSASLFAEATPDGSNALFTTREQLLSADSDHSVDLYDARVGGGIAAQNTAPPTSCLGEACQGGSPTVQIPPGIGSESVQAPGNPKPRRQRKRHRPHRHKHHRKHRRNNKQRKG